MNARLVPLIATLSLAACIPPGGEDYRIGRNDAPVETRPATSGPQIVPEQTIIADTPSWSPAVVERNARQVDGGEYIVQPGDTLFGIGMRTGSDARLIAAANGLSAMDAIRSGQKIIIPRGVYHRVRSGETGIAIARAYGVSWAEIVNLNGMQPPYLLGVFQALRLPDTALGVSTSGEQTPEQRATAFTLNIDDIVTGGEPPVAIVANANSPDLAVQQMKLGIFGGAFAWPLRGTILARYGSMGGGKVNDGLNIAGANGAPVLSSANGVVVYSGNEIGVFGGLILIDHGSGWITAYGHLSRLDVVRGDTVSAGQSIGAVGETGYVTQPQLHFEIRKDRKPINPQTVLPVNNATG